MKYIKRFLSEEEHSSYVKDNFFNYQQNIKKLINIVDNNNQNIVDVCECDAIYRIDSSISTSKMLLANDARNFKSFKVNGYDVLEKCMVGNQLWLTNIFDEYQEMEFEKPENNPPLLFCNNIYI